MIRLAWISRHAPLPSQIAAFGPGVEIIRDARPFDSAETIARRVAELRCDDLMVVAPLSVISRLCDLGLKPLWAAMQQVAPDDPRCEVAAAGRGYRFRGWRRVSRIAMEFETGPAAPRKASP